MDTLVTGPVAPIPGSNRNACLVQIYPAGPHMGERHLFGEAETVIGRDADCEICVEESSVSRRHARIQLVSDGLTAVDLNSTNGTFVNDVPITTSKLKDGDYLRVGNCIFRYLAGGNVEADYHEVIYRLTIIDALTDIHNKRYLLEFLDRELVRATRHQRCVSLVMFDIDHFKKINDNLGHMAGDYALREMSSRIKANVRLDELFARYGGEEFAVVLPETTGTGAVQLAERLRQTVADKPFHFEGETFSITISLGVATTSGREGMKAAELIHLADARLYQAKNDGRNRVVS
jgi:diguanylate cyclase (GGDEF)-like protein